jgi:hypothetical protein
MRRQTDLGAKRDEPLGRVILVPPNGVPIVRRELVMKIVIALAKGDEGRDQVVPRRMPIVERRFPKPMGERVEREDAVVHAAHPQRARIHPPAPPIAPEIAGNRSREREAHEDDERHVPSLLPAHDRALAEIAHVRHTGPAPGLDEHPADVAPPEPAIGVIRVEIGVDVAVVCAVPTSPPSNRALGGTGTSKSEEYLQGL